MSVFLDGVARGVGIGIVLVFGLGLLNWVIGALDRASSNKAKASADTDKLARATKRIQDLEAQVKSLGGQPQ